MVGFGTTKFTRAWEPALLWNQLRVLSNGQAENTNSARYITLVEGLWPRRRWE
jgi:hypothetical protein